jgi:hypothetical protein
MDSCPMAVLPEPGGESGPLLQNLEFTEMVV